MWLSQVERTVRDREVAGSSPAIPTTASSRFGRMPHTRRMTAGQYQTPVRVHWCSSTLSVRSQVESRHFANLDPIVYTSVQESGVLLTIRYLCEPRRRRGTAAAIWEDILAAFAASKVIEFAYPTQRLASVSVEEWPRPPTGRSADTEAGSSTSDTE